MQSTATETQMPTKRTTVAFLQKVKPIRGWRWISVQLSLLPASSSPTEETTVLKYIHSVVVVMKLGLSSVVSTRNPEEV